MKRRFCYLLLIVVPLIFALSNCHGSSANKKAHSVDTLKVMTYNIHHASPPSAPSDTVINLQAIAKVINGQKPDLVALQEVDVNNRRAGINLNEAAKLAKLTDMHYHFTRALYYKRGKYGDAVLSRFPIIDTTNYHLPHVKGENEELRDVCLIKVKLPDNKTVLFASTHLGLSKPTRLLQAHKIISIIKKLSDPIILSGDFNSTPSSSTISLLGNTLTRSCNKGCPFTFPSNRPTHKIDYIMYQPSKWFRAGEQHVIDGNGSDHSALVVNLYYSNSSK